MAHDCARRYDYCMNLGPEDEMKEYYNHDPVDKYQWPFRGSSASAVSSDPVGQLSTFICCRQRGNSGIYYFIIVAIPYSIGKTRSH